MRLQRPLLLVWLILICWLGGGTTFSQTDFWQQTNGPSGGSIYTLVIDSNGHVLAGTQGSGISRSTNDGEVWTHIGLSNASVYSLAIKAEGHIFAGTLGNVFRSTDNGITWDETSLGNALVNSLAVNSQGQIFAELT